MGFYFCDTFVHFFATFAYGGSVIPGLPFPAVSSRWRLMTAAGRVCRHLWYGRFIPGKLRKNREASEKKPGFMDFSVKNLPNCGFFDYV